MKIRYTVFEVNSGWMGLVGNEKGVLRIYLPALAKAPLKKRILAEFPESQESSGPFKQARKELQEYFLGKRVRFEFPLELSKVTPFRKRVYEIMSTIPYGEVRTYRWLAQMAGNPRALRAVGGANAHNQWPLAIPCHRVVGSNGVLTGFSAPGGLALKARLLELEGIIVKNNRVPLG